MKAKGDSSRAIYPPATPRLPGLHWTEDAEPWGKAILAHLIRNGADTICLDAQGTTIAWREHSRLEHSLEVGVIVISEEGRSMAAPKHLEKEAVRFFPWPVRAIARATERRYQDSGRPETTWEVEVDTEGLDEV
jgi:hypothetical protein